MLSPHEHDIVIIVASLTVSGYFKDLPAGDRWYFIKRLRDRKEDFLSFPRYSADDPYRGRYTPDSHKVDHFLLPLRLPETFAATSLDFLFQCRHPESTIHLCAIDINTEQGSTRIDVPDLAALPMFRELIVQRSVLNKETGHKKPRRARHSTRWLHAKGKVRRRTKSGK